MTVFGSVIHTATKVAIYGTGPSIGDIQWKLPSLDVKTIAINAAINYIKADFWFTLDPGTLNRLLMSRQRNGTIYYAAVPDDYGTKSATYWRHRASAEGNVIFLRRITGDGFSASKEGLSPNNYSIHTGNSAWGALQLAVHMGARKIALFGVDGYGNYYMGGKPRDLSMMADLFESAVGDLQRLGVEVVNGSPYSVVNCFPKLEAKEALQWISTQ